MRFEAKRFAPPLFRYAIWAGIAALLAAVLQFAYLGLFSRYLADDYCEAVRVRGSFPLNAVIERYTAEAWPRATVRYSNLFFVGVGESLGAYNMQITVSSMVILWAAGLTLCVRETRKFLKLDWGFSTDLLIGLALAFFSLWQAPNLFQTVYWRSSMMTHFAPLVFGAFLFALLANLLGRLENGSLPPLTYPLVFAATFIIAGFSEPPTTTMIAALPLLMLIVRLREKGPAGRRQLILLAWVLAGALAGLAAMILSPAAASAAQKKPLDILPILGKSFLYGYQFIVDSLRTAPFPMFLAALIPFLLIQLHRWTNPFSLTRRQKRTLLFVLLAIPLLLWLLIAAGFAPSAYGQSYPIERMRFLARALMIAALMLEGMLIAALTGDAPFPFGSAPLRWAFLTAFAVVVTVYPLRAVYNIYRFEIPYFQLHAEMWDARDAAIRRAVAEGATDLEVEQIDTFAGVQEYKENPYHWVNTCAAQFYGLRTLRAP